MEILEARLDLLRLDSRQIFRRIRKTQIPGARLTPSQSNDLHIREAARHLREAEQLLNRNRRDRNV
jgi:hypothetical protein